MTRGSSIAVVIVAVGCAAVFGYFTVTSSEHSSMPARAVSTMADNAVTDRESSPSTLHDVVAPNSTADESIAAQHIAVEPLSAEKVERLIKDATGDNPGSRASAIDALAAAPESTAVPVLQKVLNGGGDMDRQLALSSLHALALQQGDTTGGIRETLRQAIYDGGDEAVASGAQAALDDIERDGK